ELKDAKTAFGLLDALLRGHPAKLATGPRAKGDARTVASNVFLAQTRRGEWVKLAIVHRDKTTSNWQQYAVSIAYTLNPDEPVFAAGTGDLAKAGFEFSTAAIRATEHEIVAEKQKEADEKERHYQERITALDERALDLQGPVARPGHKVAAVMARGHAAKLGSSNAYAAASFSFEHDTRDDVKATRNDWDFVYSAHGGDDWLRVRTVTDDRGLIWDLGVMDFEQALRGDVPPTEGLERAKIQAGHLYLIHTLDSETDHWVLMKALEAEPGEALIFEWVVVEDPTALRRTLQSTDEDLKEPYARLQVLSDHGGGNPHRAFLDGSKNAYVRELSADPLDLSKSSKGGRRSMAHVVGGLVPEGKVFRVQSVEYTLHFDHTDRVDSEVRIGAFKLLDAETSRQRGAKKGDITLFTADGGLRTVTAKDLPLRGTIQVDIPIRRDQEKTVFVEGASYTRTDVVLRGRLEDAGTEAPQHATWNDSAYRSAHWALFRVLRTETDALDARMFALERYPGAVAWFERVRAHATEASFQAKIDALLALLRK
ncbi:MAG: hypothetical protein P1V36_05110, partial [Planctomycetota bacterium]|nr:hypothetical protein [Planctomycetota bacterium]